MPNEKTQAIALYSEGINDGDGLVAALDAARRARKPVVMMKVGRSEVDGAAARSHTASIAGDDAVVDAVLAELGVVPARAAERRPAHKPQSLPTCGPPPCRFSIADLSSAALR
nr:hypothetical protein [Cupriavidus sp. P-10]